MNTTTGIPQGQQEPGAVAAGSGGGDAVPKDGQAEQQTRRVGNRDPRRDPREGDILRDSFGQVHVFHEERGPGQKLDLGEWRRIMRGAIVLRCLPLVDPPPGWSR